MDNQEDDHHATRGAGFHPAIVDPALFSLAPPPPGADIPNEVVDHEAILRDDPTAVLIGPNDLTPPPPSPGPFDVDTMNQNGRTPLPNGRRTSGQTAGTITTTNPTNDVGSSTQADASPTGVSASRSSSVASFGSPVSAGPSTARPLPAASRAASRATRRAAHRRVAAAPNDGEVRRGKAGQVIPPRKAPGGSSRRHDVIPQPVPKKWTVDQMRTLVQMRLAEKSFEDIHVATGHTREACESKASSLGVLRGKMKTGYKNPYSN